MLSRTCDTRIPGPVWADAFIHVFGRTSRTFGQRRLGQRIYFSRACRRKCHPLRQVSTSKKAVSTSAHGALMSVTASKLMATSDTPFEVEEFSFGIGGTGYFYTGDFDDTYQEINLSFGFEMLSVDVAIGKYDNFAGPTLDYTFASATLENEGFHGTVGNFSQDFKGTYVDVGYGFSVADEIDVSVSWIYSDKDLAFNGGAG